VIGLGVLVAGLVLMVVWRLRDSEFWRERAGVADPDLVRGTGGRRP
jgi:hypothetical protein